LNVVHTGHASQLWQAYDDARQRMVGIKTLQERFWRDREQIGYLRWEYKVASTLCHPRILEIYTFDIDRGRPYLAMEWFPGRNLKQRLLQGLEKLLHLLPKAIEQAAEALAYFHGKGWVHRDVKPDNFLMSDSGDVKLIDFALAQRSRHGLAKLLAPWSKVQGTQSYMSPEQIRGKALDERADVYSFACMVHELLCGKPPFTGGTPQELLNKHLRAAPPLLDAAERNLKPEFAQFVRRCLAKAPAERPATMTAVLEELRRVGIFRIQPRPPQEPLPTSSS
jgi:serine/threonine protein kinase